MQVKVKERCFTYTKLKMLASKKRSSLFRRSITDGEKKVLSNLRTSQLLQQKNKIQKREREKRFGLILIFIFIKTKSPTNLFTKTNCSLKLPMEQHVLKIVNNCLNSNIYSYLETSVGQSSNLYLNVVHCFNASVN